MLWFLKQLHKNTTEITDEEVQTFRKHLADIDDVTAPIYVHTALFEMGILLGAILGFAPKLTQHANWIRVSSGLFGDFAIDIIVEMNAALIGAGATAYLLGILLHQTHAPDGNSGTAPFPLAKLIATTPLPSPHPPPST